MVPDAWPQQTMLCCRTWRANWWCFLCFKILWWTIFHMVYCYRMSYDVVCYVVFLVHYIYIYSQILIVHALSRAILTKKAQPASAVAPNVDLGSGSAGSRTKIDRSSKLVKWLGPRWPVAQNFRAKRGPEAQSIPIPSRSPCFGDKHLQESLNLFFYGICFGGVPSSVLGRF